MTRPLTLHPDRLFPSDPGQRDIARRLYAEVASLPIISPHGHTDPSWFADNAPFGNAAELLLHPDHYLFRMLYSQGISLDALGIGNRDADPRESWRLFARNYRLFRGTPSMFCNWQDERDHVRPQAALIRPSISPFTASSDSIARSYVERVMFSRPIS